MLIQEGELFGFRRWFEDYAPAVRNSVMRTQVRHLAHGLLAKGRGQVSAVAVGLLVARQQLGPVARENGEEVLPRAVLEVQHARPQSGRPGSPRGLDDLLEQLRPVGQARKDGRHTYADVDARGHKLLDGAQPLLGMGGARLGLAPNVVVERREAAGDVQVSTSREVGQHIDVADDHRAARDHGRRVGEVAKRLQALPGKAVAAFRRLIGIGRGADDYGLFPPRPARQLAAENGGDVDLDPDRPAVAVVRWPIGAELECADIAKGAAVLAAGVGSQRPREAHVLDGVQGRFALDLDVFDVCQPRFRSGHPLKDRTNVRLRSGHIQAPASLMSEFGASPMGRPLRSLRRGRSSDDGQKSLSTHSSQRGRRASHTRRPCRIRRRESPVQSSFGTIAQTWYSIFTGSRVATSPSRLVSRITWVSTANPGESNPAPRITYAVLRPIPGILTISSIVVGTSPPNSSPRPRP